uniref:Uncharacterized protein n=1 Tax=Candidozyma auris TaxID=498019 RepID=A0A0L0NWH5_CANAR
MLQAEKQTRIENEVNKKRPLGLVLCQLVQDEPMRSENEKRLYWKA